jgi:uncharacterized lipoprotein YajG
MTRNFLKLAVCTSSIFVLAACAATPNTTSEAMASEQNVAAEAAEKSNEKTASADGELICKRQSVVGSNFNRKVCATAEQWEASEEESRRMTGDLQRGGASPGVTN